MTIQRNIYDTQTLLGVMTKMEPVSNYWLNLCFPSTVTFDTESVDFEKISDVRKLAPFVVPHAQGKPIYHKASKVTSFQPAYVKPKDVVNPARLIRKQPGELASLAPLSPQQRQQAIIADILRMHREAIERRWEWLAAKAIIDAEVTISGEGYPSRTISFGRDPSHSIALVGAAQWGQPGVNIMDDINAWRRQVFSADFGGVTNRLTVGWEAWEVMRQDSQLLEQLDTQVRGTQGNFNTGLIEGMDVEFQGRIGNLDIYLYRDYFHDDAYGVDEILDPKSVVLTGPNVQGVRAFGAIIDVNALVPMEIFPKMWVENDPSAEIIMTQSAPLMVPVNPNNTLKAKVLE